MNFHSTIGTLDVQGAYVLEDTSIHPSARYQITLPMLYSLLGKENSSHQERMGTTRDLSMTGAGVELPDRLAPGTRLTIVLELTNDTLVVDAQVVWVERPKQAEGVVSHGLAFSNLDTRSREMLGRLLQDAVPLRIGLAQPMRAIAQGTLEIELRNIGRTGACIQHRTMLRPNTNCLLSLPSPTGPVSLPAQILRSTVVGAELSPGGEQQLQYETGLTFPALTPEQETALADVLRHLGSLGGSIVRD